ncbi:MAG: OmpA family protein [Flavobacteriales bacterium]|nr:OmpA family protein [Flavobacteriales bacterium]
MKKLVGILTLVVASMAMYGQNNSIPFDKKLFKDDKDAFKIAEENLAKGNEYYEGVERVYWTQAIPYFERAQSFNPKNDELNYKLGDCYLVSNTKSKCLQYFKSAYELNPNIQQDIHYKLGRGYHLSSQFETAIKEYKIHLSKLVGKDVEDAKKLTNKLIRECEVAIELVKHPIRVWVDNLGKNINSSYPDYAAQITADESMIIFTTRRPSVYNEELINGMYNEDVYISRKDENGNWSKATLISKNINVKDNDAISGLSPDGNKLFLYYHSGNDGGNLYESNWVNNEWTKPEDLGKNINTNKSWDTDASLSYDGKRLFFVSDKEGTMGARDIWYSDWDEEKKRWGESKNMGAPINTEYDEVGIFIHPDGKTIYFSSNGHKGMGGFDIYSSELQADGTWSAPVNIGYPVSTPDDDVFFTISASGIHGYYASFREDGEGEKDLYMITFLGKPKAPLLAGEDNLIASITKPVEEEIVQPKLEVAVKNLSILKGIVLDADTKKPIKATVELTDNKSNTQVSVVETPAENGKFLMSLPAGKNYGIAVKAEGYLFHSENFDIPADAGYQEYEKVIYMKKVKVGESIVLRNIFFDLDKYSLKDESKTELDRLFNLLVENPTLVIEISGHTDTQGSAAYNQQLSEDRAKAVVDYLVAYGIERERFEFKGYGETKPMISDSEIAKMKSSTQKQEAHAQNRRTEFKILKF